MWKKWKLSHCSISFGETVHNHYWYGKRLTHKWKTFLLFKTEKWQKFPVLFACHSSSSFVFRQAHKLHACLRGWNGSLEASLIAIVSWALNVLQSKAGNDPLKAYFTVSLPFIQRFDVFRCLLNALLLWTFHDLLNILIGWGVDILIERYGFFFIPSIVLTTSR